MRRKEMVQVGSETLTLKVTEALAKDVGRVIARLDPQDMTRIGAETGVLSRSRARELL